MSSPRSIGSSFLPNFKASRRRSSTSPSRSPNLFGARSRESPPREQSQSQSSTASYDALIRSFEAYVAANPLPCSPFPGASFPGNPSDIDVARRRIADYEGFALRALSCASREGTSSRDSEALAPTSPTFQSLISVDPLTRISDLSALRIAQYKAYLSPFRRLPPEIFLLIVQWHCRIDQAARFWREEQGGSPLSSVCETFRATILSSPALFSTISITLREQETRNAPPLHNEKLSYRRKLIRQNNALARKLEYAVDAPLSVFITFVNSWDEYDPTLAWSREIDLEVDVLLARVTAVSRRVHQLELFGGRQRRQVEVLLSTLFRASDWTTLRSMKIKTPPDPGELSTRIPLPFCPRLREIRLLGDSCAAFETIASTITHLLLQAHSDIPTTLRFVKSCTALEHLRLLIGGAYGEPIDASERHATCLARVRYLKTSLDDAIFVYLRLPSLFALELGRVWRARERAPLDQDAVLGTFLRASRCKPRILSLQEQSIDILHQPGLQLVRVLMYTENRVPLVEAIQFLADNPMIAADLEAVALDKKWGQFIDQPTERQDLQKALRAAVVARSALRDIYLSTPSRPLTGEPYLPTMPTYLAQDPFLQRLRIGSIREAKALDHEGQLRYLSAIIGPIRLGLREEG